MGNEQIRYDNPTPQRFTDDVASSLFFLVARSANRVIHSGVSRGSSKPARDCSPLSSVTSGRKRFTIFIAYPVRFGNSAFPAIAPRAQNVKVSDGWPRRNAATIFRAARLASIEISGAPAPAENHANSASPLPLNLAFTCEPVRMSPGATVVT